MTPHQEDILGAGVEIDEEPQVVGIAEIHHQKYDNIIPLTKRQLVNHLRKISNALFTRISEDNWEKHEEVAVNYVDLKASIDDYYDENITHRDQTNKLDDSVINKKITKATESLTKFSTNITDLQSSVNTLQAHALKQNEELAAWANCSTNMAWNLGSRLSGLERAQNHIQSSMSSLKEDTHSIKNMMTGMYEVFKGQSSGSVAPTLALTHIPTNVEGENATHTATEEPPSHTEEEIGEPKRAIPISTIQPTEVPLTLAQPITTIITHPESSQAFPRNDKGKRIANESDENLSKRLVPASTIVHPDPDALIPYIINGEVYHLTAKQLQEQMDKEELIKKSEEEARLLAISKPEVIKVVQEEAEKIGLDPRKIASAKAGEKLKPETITDIKIHPKTKPVVITVYRGTDGRNFDVHRPFAFGAFGISELDELREIIPKNKNAVVHNLMNSLSRRYERIRKIPEELGIKSALPALAREQASSQSSRKKRKHMELKPKTKFPRLECNRTLPENVMFINNMVIEEPEYGIFFTDEFGDQAFQRWSNIDKVGMEALVSYLVAASMIKSPENARFSLKLKKLIAEHPDQEKLKSKKVKLEALGYEMN
ncbi:hypothetical protein Tco_1354867 [Tanacetum coccineum]